MRIDPRAWELATRWELHVYETIRSRDGRASPPIEVRPPGQELLERARREVKSIDPDMCWWWRVGDVAFAGARQLHPGRWRLVASWVAPERRGEGLGAELLAARLEWLAWRWPLSIDVITPRPRSYLELGFDEVRRHKAGTSHMRWQS